MNFQGLITEFLFHCSIERKLADNTIDAYRHDLASFIRFVGDYSVETVLTVEKLRAYLAEMISVRKLSNATARRRIACLRAICAYAKEKNGIEDPFVTWSPSIKRSKRLPRALSGSEVKLLIKNNIDINLVDEDTVFCVLLLGATGLRVSELCKRQTKPIYLNPSNPATLQ